MKATGIVRPIDQLGRVVIPIELRRTLDIKEGDPLEIYVDGDRIMLKKYAPGCVLCGNVEQELTSLYPGKLICKPCVGIVRALKQ
jgi:transcriptional pleiotropic regulator of transition state genes